MPRPKKSKVNAGKNLGPGISTAETGPTAVEDATEENNIELDAGTPKDSYKATTAP